MSLSIEHLWLPYNQMKTSPPPIEVSATEASHLILADGRRVIDGIASWWTACHGYNHPHLVAAIMSQVQTMPHVMLGGLVHEPAAMLTQRLAEILPGDLSKIFLCDSGSVAVEIALKMATQYWINQGRRDRTRFVCFRYAYHGDTAGAMSVCDPDDSMHAHFKGFLLEQYPALLPATPDEWNQYENFLATHREHIAGVIIEPLVQMAAGMKFHEPHQLKQIHESCRRHGLLLIADEIATGFGRTGTMFAVEQADIVPDIMCIGKALAGGCVSLAATAATGQVYRQFHSESAEHALMHGPTFMGNPLACAAANASLDLFRSEPRLQQVAAIEQQFATAADHFQSLPHVVRSQFRGALLAVELDQSLDPQPMQDFFLARNIWLRPIHNVIYCCPSLNMCPADVQSILTAIGDFLESRIAER